MDQGCTQCGVPHSSAIPCRIPDEKGRLPLETMTPEEMARESLAIARATQDLVEKFFADLMSGQLSLPGPLGMFAKMMGR